MLKDITKKGHLLQKQELETRLHIKLLWIQYFQLQSTFTQKHFKIDLIKELKDFE